MQLNDPIGDLIARINNAQMRKKSKVSTPGSRLRVRVLDVLKSDSFAAIPPSSTRTAAARSRSS